jgi:hypothetical protein
VTGQTFDPQSFGAAARRLAGLTAQMLGWRPAEFWDATPGELAAILLPDVGGGGAPLSRDEFTRMMERDDA